MSMPGCDAQGCNRIQLLWRCIGRGGVHHADGFQSLRGALVEDRPRLAEIDVLLLLAPKAVVGVVDFFSYPAGWEKRLVAVVYRRLNVTVVGQHRVRCRENT